VGPTLWEDHPIGLGRLLRCRGIAITCQPSTVRARACARHVG
jgi:hypothetical protein